jgi:site-specific DNA recombinase
MADITRKKKRLAAAQKRIKEMEKLMCKIYEDNALGKLPDARLRRDKRPAVTSRVGH